MPRIEQSCYSHMSNLLAASRTAQSHQILETQKMIRKTKQQFKFTTAKSQSQFTTQANKQNKDKHNTKNQSTSKKAKENKQTCCATLLYRQASGLLDKTARKIESQGQDKNKEYCASKETINCKQGRQFADQNINPMNSITDRPCSNDKSQQLNDHACEEEQDNSQDDYSVYSCDLTTGETRQFRVFSNDCQQCEACSQDQSSCLPSNTCCSCCSDLSAHHQAQSYSSLKNQETFELTPDNPVHSQFSLIPIQRQLAPNTELYLYGELIIEGGYSAEQEKEVNSFCNWKIMFQASKQPQFLRLSASNKWQASEEIAQAAQLCLHTDQLHDLGVMLMNFQRVFQHIKQSLTELAEYIQTFSLHNYLLNRQKIFQNLSDNYLATISAQSVYFAIKIQPNFNTKQIEFSDLIFSNGLLELMNADPDVFAHLSLHGKAPEFFGWKARLLFLKHRLMTFLRLDQNYNEQDEIDLLSRDGFRVPAKAKREKISFGIDEIVPQLPLAPFAEVLIIYYLEIEETTKQQLAYLRNTHQQQQSEQQCITSGSSQEPCGMNDFSEFNAYSLETQAFLDMYYSNFNPKQNAKKKNNGNKNSSSKNKNSSLGENNSSNIIQSES